MALDVANAFLDLKLKPDPVLGKLLGGRERKETVLGHIRRDGCGVHQHLGLIIKSLHAFPKTWLFSRKADAAPCPVETKLTLGVGT